MISYLYVSVNRAILKEYIMNYDWNFSRLVPYTEAFVAGTITTISITLLVIIIGTIFGIILGLLLRDSIFRVFLIPVIDIVRALPPLVLILFMYYLLTVQVIGTVVQAYWVVVIAMSLNLAAFTSDLVRAAITNVPIGEIDAGKALGLTRGQITKNIIMPHVLREILPGMVVLYIGMLKMSSLASIINVREVVYTAQTVIADVARSLEAWIIVAFIYIILVLPSSYGFRRLEASVNKIMSGGSRS